MVKRDMSNSPLMNGPIKAGFPNPAEDAGGLALNLNEYLVRHPISTYYLRVEGDAMADAGMADGDIVVVDRALDPRSGDIVVAILDSEFVLRHLRQEGRSAWLLAGQPDHPPLALHEVNDAIIWGVVTFTIHKQRPV